MNDSTYMKAYARRMFAVSINAVNEMYDLVRDDVPATVAARLDELRHEACASLAELEWDHLELIKHFP